MIEAIESYVRHVQQLALLQIQVVQETKVLSLIRQIILGWRDGSRGRLVDDILVYVCHSELCFEMYERLEFRSWPRRVRGEKSCAYR